MKQSVPVILSGLASVGLIKVYGEEQKTNSQGWFSLFPEMRELPNQLRRLRLCGDVLVLQLKKSRSDNAQSTDSSTRFNQARGHGGEETVSIFWACPCGSSISRVCISSPVDKTTL